MVLSDKRLERRRRIRRVPVSMALTHLCSVALLKFLVTWSQGCILGAILGALMSMLQFIAPLIGPGLQLATTIVGTVGQAQAAQAQAQPQQAAPQGGFTPQTNTPANAAQPLNNGTVTGTNTITVPVISSVGKTDSKGNPVSASSSAADKQARIDALNKDKTTFEATRTRIQQEIDTLNAKNPRTELENQELATLQDQLTKTNDGLTAIDAEIKALS